MAAVNSKKKVQVMDETSCSRFSSYPYESMYGIFTYIWLFSMVKKQVNVGKYTIHGCYGIKHCNDFCYDIDYINSLAGYLSINRVCDPTSGTIIEGTSEKDPQNHFELLRFIGIPY